MKKLTLGFFASMLLMAVFSCASQKNGKVGADKIKFEKIVYHSSRCFGFCPQIDMEIDNNRNIVLHRDFFKRKGETDSANTGNFKGTLSKEKYDELLHALDTADYNNWDFPDITCCDGVVTTLIIYSNGKRKYLKSMTPPENAAAFINFLKKLGTETTLPKTDDDISLED